MELLTKVCSYYHLSLFLSIEQNKDERERKTGGITISYKAGTRNGRALTLNVIISKVQLEGGYGC